VNPLRIDTHQHFWNLNKVAYPRLTPDDGRLYANYEPRDLDPQRQAAGIDLTVLVQSMNSLEDTVAMLTQAEDYAWIGGVVGWVPLADPAAARVALNRFRRHPKFRGMRHLLHLEADADWILQSAVRKSLRLLAEYGLSFDFGAIYPQHLQHVAPLAAALPELAMIIDHLGAPPIKARAFGAWAEQLAAAARCPNVYAKLSGLVTSADHANWTVADLVPYVDFALEHFGADRLMFGSDWPVCTLAADYGLVQAALKQALAPRTEAERAAIFGGTAARVYRLAAPAA
jgi:L-fuconolactonase